MKKAACVLLLSLFISFQASADDIEELLDFISDRVLSVHIELKLLDSNQEITWDAESRHVTVVGRSVNVRLVAEELIIDAYITPFGDAAENLVLVANGEIWLSDRQSGDGIRYESFIKSLPVKPEETVIFFPLGVAVDSEANIYTIQMEINVKPYKEFTGQIE
ncbi:MAG: hypothetical protein JW852_06620 [Spirochaetales bacterium]|nr:hypothetical protein [Spirochaetales bacterium]